MYICSRKHKNFEYNNDEFDECMVVASLEIKIVAGYDAVYVFIKYQGLVVNATSPFNVR